MTSFERNSSRNSYATARKLTAQLLFFVERQKPSNGAGFRGVSSCASLGMQLRNSSSYFVQLLAQLLRNCSEKSERRNPEIKDGNCERG